MVWYSHLFQNFPQFIVINTVNGFGIVNKAEIDVFLELSCFFHDPADVGHLISGSSAFSKTSLNIWKFMVHILLKPGLEHPLGQSKSRGWNQNPAAGKTPCPCIYQEAKQSPIGQTLHLLDRENSSHGGGEEEGMDFVEQYSDLLMGWGA